MNNISTMNEINLTTNQPIFNNSYNTTIQGYNLTKLTTSPLFANYTNLTTISNLTTLVFTNVTNFETTKHNLTSIQTTNLFNLSTLLKETIRATTTTTSTTTKLYKHVV